MAIYGYESLEIHGLRQDGGVRQLYQGGGDAPLFTVGHLPYDCRFGAGVGAVLVGAQPRRGAPYRRGVTAAALCTEAVSGL